MYVQDADNNICRCDQTSDCSDVSDEKGCKIVVIDPKTYMKDKPPKQAKVMLKVELLKVLEIAELAMMFRTQFKVYLEWFDYRITFYNLHKNQDLNTLVEDEKQKIWSPSLVFYNTDKKLRSLTDEESLIKVSREGNFTRNNIYT